MEFMLIISWMLILSAGESVGTNSDNVQLISCRSLPTTSGQTIQLVIKWGSRQMTGRNHGNFEHFECPTSPKICTIPGCLSSPCENKCTCVETDHSYVCMCPDGVSDDPSEGK
eukprot:XP_011673301.1 PREDICTED: neurogenic locus notch homolog protein 2-like [Strongylocentrotus purpuratus]